MRVIFFVCDLSDKLERERWEKEIRERESDHVQVPCPEHCIGDPGHKLISQNSPTYPTAHWHRKFSVQWPWFEQVLLSFFAIQSWREGFSSSSFSSSFVELLEQSSSCHDDEHEHFPTLLSHVPWPCGFRRCYVWVDVSVNKIRTLQSFGHSFSSHVSLVYPFSQKHVSSIHMPCTHGGSHFVFLILHVEPSYPGSQTQ